MSAAASSTYMTAGQFAKQWGVCLRTVHYYCSRGKIPGVKKTGQEWRIPAGAKRPADGRVRHKWNPRTGEYEDIDH